MKNTIVVHFVASATLLVALTGCETVAEEATEAVGFEYTAQLAAAAGGTGSGKADVSLNDATNMLCTDLELSSGVAMTAGHIMGPGDSVVADIDVPEGDDRDPVVTLPLAPAVPCQLQPDRFPHLGRRRVAAPLALPPIAPAVGKAHGTSTASSACVMK